LRSMAMLRGSSARVFGRRKGDGSLGGAKAAFVAVEAAPVLVGREAAIGGSVLVVTTPSPSANARQAAPEKATAHLRAGRRVAGTFSSTLAGRYVVPRTLRSSLLQTGHFTLWPE
jgi:hypothetical protein